MQTGQNSIAPDNALPQIEQIRLSSVFMGLTALQLRSEPHHPSADRGRVPQELRVPLTITGKSMFRNKIPETLRPSCLCKLTKPDCLAASPLARPIDNRHLGLELKSD
jgi:hypothetical protein